MKVLFVDDDMMVLSGVRRSLFSHRDLECQYAASAEDALEALERGPFDVVVSDMRMPDMDGAGLLAVVAQRWPATLRIILSGQTGEAAALRAVPVAHQFLSKPCPTELLLETIRSGTRQRESPAAGPGLAALVGRVGALPAPPTLFVELGTVMANPNADNAAIGRVLQRAPVVVAKLLQLVNSSFFATPQRIVGVEQAVSRLGLRIVRALALTEGVFANENGNSVYSPSQLQRLRDEAVVAMTTAAAISTGSIRDTAVTASLLAEIGVPLLAAAAPELAIAVRDAVDAGADQTESELAITGTTHAAFAAHILSLWNLPLDVVDAVARHHEPPGAWNAATVVSLAWAIAQRKPVDLDLVAAAGAPHTSLVALRELVHASA